MTFITTPAPVKVLFFARLRQHMGMAELLVPLPHSMPLHQFSAQLALQYPAFAELPQPVMMAVNQVFAQAHTAVQAGDEVAYFPPVTGG